MPHIKTSRFTPAALTNRGFRLVVSCALLMTAAGGGARAEPPLVQASLPIVVFDFELDDKSAASGIIAQDENDKAYLREATEQAKRSLAATGQFNLIDTAPVAGDVAARQGVINCNACEVELARKLGARTEA